MPEINPLTNNQIFLKKIAENTGSDYETGDVSEINPLTIEQILLKEIAANTAGQSGDISELEGKVADNTAAIEAIVNEYGACNLCPTSATTTTNHGITFTINSDGSITASGTADSGHVATLDIMPQTDLNYGTYKGSGGVNEHCRIIYGRSNSSGTLIDTVDDSGGGIELTVNASTPKVSMALIIDAGTDLTTPVTFYPMLYDARLNPTGYVPYAMPNRELTERVSDRYVSVVGDGVKTHQQLMNDLYALIDRSKISKKSRFSLYYNQSLEWLCSLSFMSGNKLQFDGITGGDATTLTAYHWELSSTLADCKRVDYTMTSSGLTVSEGSSSKPGATNEYRVYY